MKNLLGPLITTMKALASRSCELATVDEMEVDLRNIGSIKPFDRALVPKNFKLAGFVLSIDGGKLGFGSTINCLSERKVQD